MKNARPIGIWKRRPQVVGQVDLRQPHDPVAGGPVLGIAGAQRPAALAHALDPALDQLQQVAVVGRHGRAADVAALVGIARPARAGRGRRPGAVTQPAHHLGAAAACDRLGDGRAVRAGGRAPDRRRRCPSRRQRHLDAAPGRAAAAPARAGAGRRPSSGRRGAGSTCARSRGSAARPSSSSPSCSARRSRRSGRGRRAACPPRWRPRARRRRPRPSPTRRPRALPAGRRSNQDGVGAGASGRRSMRATAAAAGGGAGPGLLDALDLQPVQVGRGLLERLLDGELERDRRRRAAGAAALAAGSGRPRRPAPAARRCRRATPCRAARCSSASATRSSSGTGCRSWIMQQGRHQRVVRERAAPARRRSPASATTSTIRSRPAPYICTTADTSSSATARVAASPADSSRSCSSCTRPTSSSGVSLGGRSACRPPPRPAPSACARPSAPCRRRCTCARRRAGTGRTSAPPA